MAEISTGDGRRDRDSDLHRLSGRALRYLPAGMLRDNSVVSLYLRILAILLVYLVIDALQFRATHLAPAAYFEPSLTLEFFKRISWPGTAAIIAAFYVLFRWGRLCMRWDELEFGRSLRAFIVFNAVILAWPLATYDFNYYFAQGHFADRLGLLLLLAGVAYRPAFVMPFVLLASIMLWQFGQPGLGGTIFPHKLQVLNALTLFAAFFLLRSSVGRPKSSDYLILVSCLVAAAYWLPAVAKMQIDWLEHVNLHLMPVAAYAHGWLSFVDPGRMLGWVQQLDRFDFALALMTLIIEAACLLFLLHRKVSLALLAGVVIFHFGVFAMYGFFFWTWILLDVSLLVLLCRLRPAHAASLYKLPAFCLSVVLIAGAGWWAKPPALAWHDTALSYTFRIDAIDSRGGRWTLSPKYFGPYADIFTMSAFYYLVDQHGTLVGAYGVSKDGELSDQINNAASPEEILALEASDAPLRYNEIRAAQFYGFLRDYAANRERLGPRAAWLGKIAAPQQFYSFRGSAHTADDAAIEELIVIEVTTFYDGSRLDIFREVELRRVSVSSD